jgi:tyrosine-protein kinase Etk/Wzc
MDPREAGTFDRQIDILALLATLNAGRRLIIGGTLILCLLAAGVSFLIPNQYRGTVQLLPPKEQREGLGFSDLLSALPIPSLRLGEKGTPADIFIATLKSETVRRQMVAYFDLVKTYEVETVTDAIEGLADLTTIDKSEQGTILIKVLDRDPQRAADMANHYVALLDSTNKRISQSTASERLNFVRFLLASENTKLEEVMSKLQVFQSDHNAISIEDQAKAVIRAAYEMQTQAIELEITRKGLLASGLDESHASIKKLEQEFLLRQQVLAFLRDGQNDPKLAVDRDKQFGLDLQENLFLPLRQIPKVAQDYATLEKDVLVQKALMQLLLQQEAEALIEASNTTSTVQVLDAAVPPEIKASPRRFLIVFITGLLSLFASTCYVAGRGFVRDLWARWRARPQS